MKIKLSLIALATVFSSWAHAHEGSHGAGLLANIWHTLSQPDHWLLLAGLVALAAVATKLTGLRKHIKNREHSQ